MREQYKIGSHAKMRMTQRNIPLLWVQKAFKHGARRNGRVNTNTIRISFGKNRCQLAIDDIIDNVAERDSIETETFLEISDAVDSLKELKKLGGLEIIFNDQIKEVVTLYTTNDNIKRSQFNVY